MGNGQTAESDDVLYAKHSVYSNYVGYDGGIAGAGHGKGKTNQVRKFFGRGEEIECFWV